jgi:putative spermidine/putrescine transport system substrate-binding protein
LAIDSDLTTARGGDTRRGFVGKGMGLAVGASPLAALALQACGGGEDSGGGGDLKVFTIADAGGTTARIRRETWGGAFTDETGVPTRSTPMDYGKFAAQVERKRMEWNWLDAEGWFALGNPDLFIDLDYDELGVKEDDLFPVKNAYTPKALLAYHTCYGIAYRTDTDGAFPKTWPEFFDTKSIPGKRAIFNWPYGTVEIALLADGVAYEELYPLDLDRAFNKLDSIRDDMIFWNTGAESQQLLSAGSVDFAQAWHNRVAQLSEGGAPVDLEWNENLQIIVHHTISKHQPAPDLCVEFIKQALAPEPSSQFAAAALLSPPTREAYDLLSEDTKRWMSINPEYLDQSVGAIDDDWWGENLDDVSTKWTEWAGG